MNEQTTENLDTAQNAADHINNFCQSLIASGDFSTANPLYDPWSAQNCGLSASEAGANWLSAPTNITSLSVKELWNGALYSPVERTINIGVDWVSNHMKPLFELVRIPIDGLLYLVNLLLLNCPSLLIIALLAFTAWKLVGKILGVGTAISLLLLIILGVWEQTMQTLSLVITSVIFCIVIGLPLGIIAALSNRINRIIRPLLDIMQTTPSFVYLVPIVILLGTGAVSGIIVTIIFALPPLVRMTNLGIRQVRSDLIEAATAYGASPWQMLVKVQLPLALPSIMAGVNQSLMLAISMVVVAAMISVPGLGQMVYESIGSVNMGKGVIGGAGIVILAIILDRISQALGAKTSRN